VGAVLAASVVIDDVSELRDYAALRLNVNTTVDVVTVSAPTIVLGSSQPRSVLVDDAESRYVIRRRRGGGGAVLLRPGDLWVDVWMVRSDPRWTDDIVAAAVIVGQWWALALGAVSPDRYEVQSSSIPTPTELAAACFAGRGAGEVFAPAGKIVGLTQWRVREGALISGALLVDDSTPLVDELAEPTEQLSSALAHPSLRSIGIQDTSLVQGELLRRAQPALQIFSHLP
jgi:lipoate-protein ligase A